MSADVIAHGAAELVQSAPEIDLETFIPLTAEDIARVKVFLAGNTSCTKANLLSLHCSHNNLTKNGDTAAFH